MKLFNWILLIALVIVTLLLIKECNGKPGLIPPPVIINKTDSVEKALQSKIDSVVKENFELQDKYDAHKTYVKTVFKDRVVFKDRIIDTVNCRECEQEVADLTNRLQSADSLHEQTFLLTDSIIGKYETVQVLQKQKYDSLRASFDLIGEEYKKAYSIVQKPKKPKRLLWFAAGVVGGYILKSKLK